MTTPVRSNFLIVVSFTIAFAILVVANILVVCPSGNIVFASQQLISNPNPSQNTNATEITTPNSGNVNISHTISVTGFATTSVKPDKVTLSLGVQTTNNTAKTALDSNSKSMNKVIEALSAAGVKENETGTSSFSISPNYNYSEGRNIITGFTATNSIQVQSSKIANVSEWLDTAVSAGTNTVNSIDFTISDKS